MISAKFAKAEKRHIIVKVFCSQTVYDDFLLQPFSLSLSAYATGSHILLTYLCTISSAKSSFVNKHIYRSFDYAQNVAVYLYLEIALC